MTFCGLVIISSVDMIASFKLQFYQFSTMVNAFQHFNIKKNLQQER